jgi:transcriptional regulator of heat shock response
MKRKSEYTHVTYGCARILLQEGWHTEEDLRKILASIEQQKKALQQSMKTTKEEKDE